MRFWCEWIKPMMPKMQRLTGDQKTVVTFQSDMLHDWTHWFPLAAFQRVVQCSADQTWWVYFWQSFLCMSHTNYRLQFNFGKQKTVWIYSKNGQVLIYKRASVRSSLMVWRENLLRLLLPMELLPVPSVKTSWSFCIDFLVLMKLLPVFSV